MSKQYKLSFQHPLRKREKIITFYYTGELRDSQGFTHHSIIEGLIEKALEEHVGKNYGYNSQRGSSSSTGHRGYLMKWTKPSGYGITSILIDVAIEIIEEDEEVQE